MLTSRTAPSVAIGNPGAFGTNGAGARLLVDVSGPALVAGTITTAKYQLTQGDNGLRVFTASLSGTTLTIRAITAALTNSDVGLNTVTVSLPVLVGDVIGYWSTSTAPLAYSSATGTVGFSQTGPPPTAGQNIALSTFGGRVSILGTS